jgi:hypothetical protein
MRRIRKGQFDLATLDLQNTATLTVWNAVLSVQNLHRARLRNASKASPPLTAAVNK